jgi:hypothetical protein
MDSSIEAGRAVYSEMMRSVGRASKHFFVSKVNVDEE